MSTFVKTRPHAPDRFFEAEAAGLGWLAEATAGGGVRVVDVVAVRPGRIELDRLEEARPGSSAARAFGAALARTHGAGASAFGVPPAGWDGPCFIGKRPLETTPTDSWGVFYAEQRVRPYARIAREAGSIDADELELVDQACVLIAGGAFDDHEPPARLHGDLWNGNVVFTPDGVVLIDPAAHGGHRETDLAMLELFGSPHLDDVIDGYERESPLLPGRADRVPLHQLHPLAVHAASYGRGYGEALIAAARRTIALAG
ncbi:fructosamine kinase family protein [Frigoribacterium sp. 2-23]|uniref:fructosamine kinase family protein n=1 Tax=Frigoribacterium sp. 2-23 TaxID=3415006 RepID=UPI003C6F1511